MVLFVSMHYPRIELNIVERPAAYAYLTPQREKKKISANESKLLSARQSLNRELALLRGAPVGMSLRIHNMLRLSCSCEMASCTIFMF